MANFNPPQTSAAQETQQNLMFPSNYYAASGNWAAKTVSVAADRYQLLSPSDGAIKINGGMYGWTSQQTLDLSSTATWDAIAPTNYTTAANRAGVDFYVYACEPTSGLTPTFKVSANASAPTGYTTSNSVQVGGFHGLCVAVAHETTLTAWAADTVIALGETRKSTVWNGKIIRCSAKAGDFKTDPTTEPNVAAAAVGSTITDDQITWTVEQHWLEGYVAGDILPYSVWCLTHRPLSVPAGMVSAPNMTPWGDIYFASGTEANTVSAYNGTIIHNLNVGTYRRYLAAVKKRLPRREEYFHLTPGTNWSAIAGGADPATTGGKSDAYGRRMVSNIGVEDCVGSHAHVFSDVMNTANIWGGGGYAGAGDATQNNPYFVVSGLDSFTGALGVAWAVRGVSDALSSQ